MGMSGLVARSEGHKGYVLKFSFFCINYEKDSEGERPELGTHSRVQ